MQQTHLYYVHAKQGCCKIHQVQTQYEMYKMSAYWIGIILLVKLNRNHVSLSPHALSLPKILQPK